jgi:hypothetical protein
MMFREFRDCQKINYLPIESHLLLTTSNRSPDGGGEFLQ